MKQLSVVKTEEVFKLATKQTQFGRNNEHEIFRLHASIRNALEMSNYDVSVLKSFSSSSGFHDLS